MRGTKWKAPFSLVAFAAAALLATSSRGAGPFSFPHRPHLSAATIAAGGGGSDADCRVCHDYKKGEREPHLTGCDQCHIDSEHLEEKRTAAAFARPAFQHKEHLFDATGAARKDITCLTCHAVRADGDWIEYSVPTAGLGPRGTGGNGGGPFGEKTCADCHAAHEPKGGLVKQDERTGDGKACATCHMKDTSILPLKYANAARTPGERPFAHADHGGGAAECNECHAAVSKSKTIWDYDPSMATAAKCATCHLDAAGKALTAVSPRKTSVTRIDFDRFPHEKHLGEFSRMSCKTCHYPEDDEQGKKSFPGRVASAEPVGRDQLTRFAVCDACHGHEAWAPGKPSWHVEGHGTGAWACFKCHVGTVDAKGKLAIAKAEVARATAGESKFVTHRHPGVTRGGAALVDATDRAGGAQKACTDCHIAGGDELSSRLAGKPFAHDPHLPANPSAADCLQCHSSSATSRRSEDLARFDPHLGGAPLPSSAARTAKGCLECHAGATAEQLGLTGSPAPRTAVQFDHGGHVQSASLVPGRKGMSCLECHDAGGKFGYTTAEDVLNCTKCHAHEGDAAKVARTGPKTSQGDSAKCLFCHETVRGEENGRVGTPQRATIERSHLALTPGTQHHDKGGDCASCHARDGLAAVPYEERIAKASVRKSIHEDARFAKEWFNDPAIAKPGVDPQGRTCATCHRNEPRGYLRSLSGR